MERIFLLFSVAGAAQESCPLGRTVSYSSKELFDSWRAGAVSYSFVVLTHNERHTHACTREATTNSPNN